MYKIGFFVPKTHLEQVKDAMFGAGGGKLGNYSHCAWQVQGQGQFIPLQNSHAFIGEKNKLTTVDEFYVDMICSSESIREVILALKKTHPYEEPAYFVVKLAEF